MGGSVMIQPEADLATFSPIGGGYARDDNAVYSGEWRTTDVDLKSFHPIDSWFAADRNHVYWGTAVIPEATEDDFILLNQWYGKSDTYVYFFHTYPQIVEDADPVTFDVLTHERYAGMETINAIGKDGKSVFVWGKIQSGVNPGHLYR